MKNGITRRAVIKGGIVAGSIVPAMGWIARADAASPSALPALDPNEPTAVTLGFNNDSAKVDPTANPMHAIDQKCGNCEQFIGKSTDVRGGCVLFPGKSVPAAGWCKVWRKTTKSSS